MKNKYYKYSIVIFFIFTFLIFYYGLKEKNFYIEKNFKFSNYVESEKFVISVGKIAETEGHHPDIIFGWGYAKIKISTHAIKGLAESDFVLAAKIDRI